MKLFSIIAVVAILLIMAPLSFAKVVVVFDENAATEASKGKFVEGVTSHDAGSKVEIVTSTAFSGKSSLSVTQQQSYNNNMTGWKFPIDETPWMTIAWKKDGGKIIMIQMAFDSNWAYRYHDGDNTAPGWASTQVAKDIPKDWRSFTRNLTKDFKAGWNLTGLAFTPWDGTGYYDMILLTTTEEEGKTAVEPASTKATTTWGEMKR